MYKVKNSFLCLIERHEPDEDWIWKMSSNTYYCKCVHCGNYLVNGWKGSFTEHQFYRMF